MFVEKSPDAFDVLFGCAYVADGEAERELVVEARVREVGRARRVDAVHDIFVESIETRGTLRFCFSFYLWTGAEADEAEGHGREQFPINGSFDPCCEEARDAAVLAYARGQSLPTEIAYDHPQL